MSFLSFLFLEPDSFEGRPYAYLTNQIGHIFFGGTVPMFIIWFIFHVTGIYPSQTFIAGVFLASYFTFWEAAIQGWRGWDTLLDTFFVGVGASLYIFVEMDIVIDRMVTWLMIIAGTLLVTTYRQYRVMLNE